MKNIFVLLLVCSSLLGFAQEGRVLKFTIVTGSDDLRGDGNNAYFTLNLTDGTSLEEVIIGGGFVQNIPVTKEIRLSGSLIPLSQIESVTIRHDGSPRPNHPFDSYDNWDLQAIYIALLDVTNEGKEVPIYNSVNDPRRSEFVRRFTGASRNITLYKQRK